MKWAALSFSLLTVLANTGCNTAEKSINSVTISQQSDQTNVVDSAINIEYSKFVLANGLEVVFHIDRSDPVVAVALTAHVGSARETQGRTGFAHLFEHLLFLESENLGKGGLDKMSARIGGSGANGSTSRDRTNYYQTVPNDALEKMIWAEADKLGFFINTVTEEVLAKEKQVVKNEKRQSYDNRPYGHTQYVIDKNLYPESHPYNWQVIGSLSDLQNSTLQDVKDFFKSWYVPNNVTLVIAGDFDEAQAKAWVHKYFDEIKAGNEISPLAKQAANLTTTKKIYHEDNFAKLPELSLTWPTVPQYHSDSYALNVLVELLSDGKKALLNKKLIDELTLTSRVTMYHYQSELAGQLMVKVRGFENTDLNQIDQAISQALSEFEKKGFSDEDLATIKAGQETAFYRGLSSVLGKGFKLAQYNIFTQDPGFINQEAKNILAVNKADVLRVYHQYIKDKSFVATSFVPKGQKDLALENSIKAQIIEEKIVANAEQSFDAGQQSRYVNTPSSFDRASEPKYGEAPTLSVPTVWQSQLSNGLHFYGIKNSEVPLVQLEITVAGGLLFDDIQKVGVANLVAEMMNKGTKYKSPQQLEEAINKLGATISIYATQESIKLSASTLARNYQATVDLITEMLLAPRWDEKEFTLTKQDIISQIIQQQTNPNQLANNQMNKLLYGKTHILSNNLLGTLLSVEEITLADLKIFYQTKLSPNLTDIHIVGDIDETSVLTAFKKLENNWLNTKAVLPKMLPAALPTSSTLYFYDVPDAKQSQLRIGFPALNAMHKDFYSAQVMNYILGGGSFASKLTQELREGKGYTYGVRSSFSGSKSSGEFIISSGVRTNVTLEATALIKSLVENYQTDFTDQDLATTQSYYLKSNARKFETYNAKLTMLENISQYNLPINYVLARAKSVESLTLANVKSLANQHLHHQQMIYLVVGDAKSQLPRLKALGLGEPILINAN
ncbi:MULTISPECIES: pitrilysin family protein [unclassified Colwellia]|uniref:M16 family metallopeptidase n=1 Tax=unclassified Colwellia TaxID=196834 RepID=UPI0015F5D0E5|nr:MULTISPECIES: pitrilysin family protein [unclassified Colwellia]MBA6379578.1 insulinase family protein [Colwellia sp. BRX10-7]MBA6386175.1 insulinase family protein [Colwellia sp. BRX10-2]MBA6403117.1 insulinase family protein [Colwellia sp. BRX10-5]MBA6405902.1 insulinase family protein [Colwellia sp. BRX10-1]